MALIQPSVPLAKKFIDEQMRTNPDKVRCAFGGGRTYFGGVDAEGFDVFWEDSYGFTDAVDRGYNPTDILATLQVKTDVEYPQPDIWHIRIGTVIDCECTGSCPNACCYEVGDWFLSGPSLSPPESPDGFDDKDYWVLDSETCVPNPASCPRGGNRTFGQFAYSSPSQICDFKFYSKYVTLGLNKNSNPLKAREYEVCRVYKKSIDGIKDHELLGVSNFDNKRYSGLVPISFRIPQIDPQYNKAGGGNPLATGTGGHSGVNEGYRLQQRAWIYDIALCIMAYTLLGEYGDAQKMIQRGFIEQQTTAPHIVSDVPGQLYRFVGGVTHIRPDEVTTFQNQGYTILDSSQVPGGATVGSYIKDYVFKPLGSMPFSFDQFIGLEFTPPYLRTGGNAWFGAAVCHYMLRTGNRGFISNCELMADWLLTLQVNSHSDPRHGLLTGGEGSFLGDAYVFQSGPRTWCSCEHNFDSHMFFRYLHILTGKKKYKDAYKRIEEGLMRSGYVPSEGRFAQGVRLPGDGTLGSFQDLGYALDMWTWGGLFLTSIQQWGKAKKAYENAFEFFYHDGLSIVQSSSPNDFNLTFADGAKYSGFSTYFDSESINGDTQYGRDAGPSGPAPKNIWAEGTWGAIMLGYRIGDTEFVDKLRDSMARMQLIPGCGGGIISYTSGYNNLPFEQHVWAATCPTAWLIVHELDPWNTTFPVGTISVNAEEINSRRIRPDAVNKFLN